MQWLWLTFFILLSSCSYLVQTPTTSYETYPRPTYVANLQLNDKDVLLDARPFFYYSSSHIDSAFHEDIKKYFEKKTTWPKLDLSTEARVLARKGLQTNARVIALGQGRSGRGEECRLAWTLFYLGIPNVHFMKEDIVTAKRVSSSSQPPFIEEPTYWNPEYRKSMVMERNQLITAIQSKVAFKVIDTRDEKTFLQTRFPWDAEVDTRVINVYWKQFLREKDGRPDMMIIRRIEALGIEKNDSIVVIDEDGIGASCAALTLMDYGYKKVHLYAGGYNDLRQILQ